MGDRPAKEHKKAPLGYACLDEFQIRQTEGRGAAITRKCALQLGACTRISPLAGDCSRRIFWTEIQYRGCLPLSIGSIGYHFGPIPAKPLSQFELIPCRQLLLCDV